MDASMEWGSAELGFLEKLTFLESGGLNKYDAEAFLVNFTALVVALIALVEELQGYAPIPVN